MSMEAIESITPTQARLHRERMKRLSDLQKKAVPDQGISLRKTHGVDGETFEKLRRLRREAAVEKTRQEASARREAMLRAAIEAYTASCDVVVEHVDICRQPPVTLETVENSIRHIPIRVIQDVICRHYRIRLSELLSHQRTAQLVKPRQIAMYIAKKITSRSLPEIGRRFGDRDHTTVLHAVRRIEAKMAADPDFAKDVETVIQAIEAEA